MATPIGHALAGYAVYQASGETGSLETRRIFLGLCLLMGIAPDLDFIPGILEGQPALFHQGVSHSLGAAVGVSLAAALVYGVKTGHLFYAAWAWFFLAYASHLLLDFIGPDGRLPYGQPLLWPISSEYYSAPEGLKILWGMHHAADTSTATREWLAGIFKARNIGALGVELLLIFPITLWARYRSNPIGNRHDLKSHI